MRFSRSTLPLLFLLAAPAAAQGKAPAKGAPVVATAEVTPDPDGKLAKGAQLFMTRTCFGCHGKDAKTPILPDYPRLAGQNAAYVERQVKDIKSGARSNGNTLAMRGVLGLVTDDEIHLIAEYLASLK